MEMLKKVFKRVVYCINIELFASNINRPCYFFIYQEMLLRGYQPLCVLRNTYFRRK